MDLFHVGQKLRAFCSPTGLENVRHMHLTWFPKLRGDT